MPAAPQFAHIVMPNGQLQQVQIMAAGAPAGIAAGGGGLVSLGQLAGVLLLTLYIYCCFNTLLCSVFLLRKDQHFSMHIYLLPL